MLLGSIVIADSAIDLQEELNKQMKQIEAEGNDIREVKAIPTNGEAEYAMIILYRPKDE